MTGAESGAPADRLLLDTHVFLWWQQESGMLASAVARQIAEADHVYVSLATAWELAIKVTSGKLHSRESFAEAMDANRFGLLPITLEHVERAARLPVHHRDPFDRMLVAQATHERMVLVTHDRMLRAYDVPVLWA